MPDALFDALQDFKHYVQANFPFKQTVFTGDDDPSAGLNRPLGAFYAQQSGGEITALWLKNGPLDTDWEALGGIPQGVLTDADVQSSITDSAAGRLLIVGAFGLGTSAALNGHANRINSGSANTIRTSGLYGIGSSVTDMPEAGGSWHMLVSNNISEVTDTEVWQMATRSDAQQPTAYWRLRISGVWQAWQPFAPVLSVNSQTGEVTLTAADVGADPAGSAGQAETNANNYTDQELDDHNADPGAHPQKATNYLLPLEITGDLTLNSTLHRRTLYVTAATGAVLTLDDSLQPGFVCGVVALTDDPVQTAKGDLTLEGPDGDADYKIAGGGTYMAIEKLATGLWAVAGNVEVV